MAGTWGKPGRCALCLPKRGSSPFRRPQRMNIVLEAGGEDLNDEGDTWEIITEPQNFEAVAQAVRDAGVETVMSEVTMIASTYTKLEDHDDVQNVYSNFDMDAKQLEEVAG